MRNVKHLLLAALLLTSPLMTLAADDAPSADPDVTIRQDGDKTIQEYRQNGFLYAIKITPKHGKPYFLVRADGTDDNFIRSDQPDMLIPAWKIFEW
ncbi:DUF2782 domain-containing protein [Pseudomonas sp. CFBP 8770]|jgi:hypothetical protein|uniref:DUF2782 domain-containing protein n=1 Tax=Pseudomonas baltica TaxID=2762576 RepID=A0A7X1G689_9PSED|nr:MULTISPECIES: DUF2782 domain-containing protein [Pseudomonas]MBC2679212.1 DUF2782 domain-containing protein [Pseudomonas baltica]MBD8475710.1 DUF2782 domain-containing protein [Pseudomonas sp. CFBP 8773]MBD8594507.1 DUF2782 domain-containing protein [Pseudomonas sp. CFBP 8758]MBD8603871.1 DUF2782 domain-containing protein [Pseudomonas sp. CFBP 8771]MBD8624342.1 DUF2782 domain-containing protein [Pseudomonas sp. CFBP 13727]